MSDDDDNRLLSVFALHQRDGVDEFKPILLRAKTASPSSSVADDPTMT
jgi:hypothetical protein